MTLPKTWSDEENLTNEDLNANFEYLDNVLEGGATSPSIGGYSADVDQMRLQTSPGDVGSESLATSLGGEIERLRYQIDAIIGKTYWYQQPSVNLETLAANFGIQSYNNRITSGSTRANGFPLFLKPNGTTLALTLDATTAPLEVSIKGQTFTQSSDLTLNMTAAPSTNNTMALNNANPRDSDGELRTAAFPLKSLIFDAVGSNIVSKAKKNIAVSMGGEYIMGYLKSAAAGAAYMIDARRGWFFNSALNPVKAVTQADNNVATLLSLAWIFYRNASNTASIFASYNDPVYSSTAPASPLFNDMWFNIDTNVWMRYDGVQWFDYDCVMIGYAVANTTACIGARSLEFTAAYAETNNLKITLKSPTELFIVPGGALNVAGSLFRYPESGKVITPTDLDPDSAALTTGMTVYFYVNFNGTTSVSSVHPNNRDDLFGLYHPFSNARCFASATYSTFVLPGGEFVLPKLVQDVRNGGVALPTSASTTSVAPVLVGSSSVDFLWAGGSIQVEFASTGATSQIVTTTVGSSSNFGSVFRITLTNLETNVVFGSRVITLYNQNTGTIVAPISALDTMNLLPNGIDSSDPYSMVRVNLYIYSDNGTTTTAIGGCIISVSEELK